MLSSTSYSSSDWLDCQHLVLFASVWLYSWLFDKEIRGLCTFYVESTYYAYVYLAHIECDTTVHGETIQRLRVVQGRPSILSSGSCTRLAKLYSQCDTK